MRLVSIAAVLAATTFVSAPLFADVGPPPTCEKGKHHEYLMGHRCVPDGSHVDKDANGNVIIVPDKALNAAPPVPTATPVAASSADAPLPSVATPPPNRGCACSVTDGGGGIVGMSAALGTAILFGLRRRRSSKPRT
ncbi:Hypothetical protein A7982_07581 [Minicystis rosea]|nr:Hypothetical protein A7982_07581 [Minicystis rosea]